VGGNNNNNNNSSSNNSVGVTTNYKRTKIESFLSENCILMSLGINIYQSILLYIGTNILC